MNKNTLRSAVPRVRHRSAVTRSPFPRVRHRSAVTRSPFPRIRHRSAGFFLSGLAFSTVVVSALFWLMYQLVSIINVEVPPKTPPIGLAFIDINRELTPPPPEDRKPEKPPVFDQPLYDRNTKWESNGGDPTINISIPNPGPLLGSHGSGKIGIGERSYMPLTEIQPNYPERALVRGIEGTCVVIYTITRTGSVQDVRVDESQCTSSLFHSASAKAAAKFKYAPRIVDGETIETRNVTKLFRFSITE